MNRKAVQSILVGLTLLFPIISVDAFAQFEQDTRMPTTISLDLIDQCANSMTCNAKLFTGTTVEFTGMLTDGNDTPLPDREVRIAALIPTPEVITLTTGTTDIDGMFTAEWTVTLSRQESAFTDVLSQMRSESLEIFAEFPGDEKGAPSRSNRLALSLSVNTVHNIVNSDRNVYNEGDTALIFIAFIDSNDEFMDPDSIHATHNNEPIELFKNKVGSYTYTVDALAKQHHQVVVVPFKEGFNANTAFLTIIVAGLR